MIRKNKAALALAGTLALVAALPGCSRSSDDAPAPDNAIEENYQAEPQPEPLPIENMTPAPPPPPAVDMNTSAEALPPATTPSEDEQMADDASATGMTARASRDQPPEDEPATDGNFGDRD